MASRSFYNEGKAVTETVYLWLGKTHVARSGTMAFGAATPKWTYFPNTSRKGEKHRDLCLVDFC